MTKFYSTIKALLFWSALLNTGLAIAQQDTLRVMAYNVLYYGDRPACQGPHSTSHNYLKTIITYTTPDVLGLEKMAAIPMYSGDHSGSAPTGFADSVLQFALNAAFPNKYAYCTYTNTSAADDVAILFYNKQKLGFAGITSSYINVNDFNTYKLYYLSTNLATTHDTIFLYVTLNHTASGSSSSNAAARAAQIGGEMAALQTKFTQLPNMINMGDFNTHNSMEACYQTLVAPANAAFRFYDPPFYPDATYTYPADWDANPSSYAASLTTSTRQSSSVPNSCGTSGGGKSWYDHLFLSGAIINNTLRVAYLPHSYKTVGNDGLRNGISINDMPTNTAAPAAVINALFQMSNKYPVMVDLVVDLSPVGVSSVNPINPQIAITNPVSDALSIHFDPSFLGAAIHLKVVDLLGRFVVQNTVYVSTQFMQLPFDIAPGIYYVEILGSGGQLAKQMIVKQ